MRVDRIHLADFRNHRDTTIELAPGLTVLAGRNGQGKTNVLEAVAFLATLRSFRGATADALVRAGASSAVVRAEGLRSGERDARIDAEINRVGRTRVLVDGQRLRRARDLVGALRVTVFSPDDLSIVKAGPSVRRDVLDDSLVALDPRHDAVRTELDRILRQRNALLRQMGGATSPEASLTLDVWDAKLVPVGQKVTAARMALVERLAPLVSAAYAHLAGAVAVRPQVTLAYRPTASPGEMAEALEQARGLDVRRGTTTTGPHRDDLELLLGGQPARTHASQGEQRTLALALKLGAHRLVTTDTGTAPLLLLDDVFSELDPGRASALVAHLPPGQAVLTTADRLPPGAQAELRYQVEDGRIVCDR